MNNAESHPRKFKNILINPKFQLKLMSYFSVLFVLTTLSFYSTTFLLFWKMKQKAMAVGIPDGHVFYRFLSNQKSEFDSLFMGLAIFHFLLLIGTGFLVSHRIAGPIHKLKEFLSKGQSNPSDFKLRDSDFFKELEPIVKDLKADERP